MILLVLNIKLKKKEDIKKVKQAIKILSDFNKNGFNP